MAPRRREGLAEVGVSKSPGLDPPSIPAVEAKEEAKCVYIYKSRILILGQNLDFTMSVWSLDDLPNATVSFCI
jgi:hypothetical protein